jgi:DNA helicase TIP49 (TBP-interacting protein)
VAIDPATAKIIGRYAMTGIESPHGIALDVTERLAFVRQNPGSGQDFFTTASWHNSPLSLEQAAVLPI